MHHMALFRFTCKFEIILINSPENIQRASSVPKTHVCPFTNPIAVYWTYGFGRIETEALGSRLKLSNPSRIEASSFCRSRMSGIMSSETQFQGIFFRCIVFHKFSGNCSMVFLLETTTRVLGRRGIGNLRCLSETCARGA